MTDKTVDDGQADLEERENAEGAEDVKYDVLLSDDALLVYLNIPSKADAAAVDKKLGLLGQFPCLGHLYDPLYEAAHLPFEVFVTYAGHYGIYYEVSEQKKAVFIVFIEDQRRDPNSRFTAV